MTGWNGNFPFSRIALVTISNGTIVATTVTESIGDGFLNVDIDDKLAGTLGLGKTGYFVVTIGTVAID